MTRVSAPAPKSEKDVMYEEPQPVGPGPRVRDSFAPSKTSLTKKKMKKKLLEVADQTIQVGVGEMLMWNKPEWFFLIVGAIVSVIAGAALPAVCILFGDLYGVSFLLA